MKILLAAEETAGIKTLRLISKSSHSLAGVLTSQNANSISNIGLEARNLGIPVLPAKKVREPQFASWIHTHQVDLLLNVHSLYIICDEVIHALPFGGYNLHPGPLPKYAGLNAPGWAIFNGETQHSVTFHRIRNGVDVGEIISEANFPISPDDTGLSVSLECVKKGLSLIEQFLVDLDKNPPDITGRPQDLSKRNYYGKGHIPWDGKILWKASSKEIDAFVRACNYSPFESPWGEPVTTMDDKKISVLKTEITDKPSPQKPGIIGSPVKDSVPVSTGDRQILVHRCKMNGKVEDARSVLIPGEILR